MQIQKNLTQIQATVEQTGQHVKAIQQDTQAIVELLKNELNVKNDQIAFLQNQLQTQKPEISAKAKELARQIPDDADAYALALKAIAQERFDEAMQLLDKAQASKEAELADIYEAKGKTQYYQGLYAKAAKWYQKALALKPDDARLLNNTGLMFHDAGNYEQAEPLYQRSLAISEKTLGKDHPTTKTIRDNLQQLHAHLHGQFQVQVKAVLPHSQAEQLGLQAGDILTHYNNKPILGVAAFIYGRSLEPATNPVQELKVLRAGKALVFKVKPGKIGAELQEHAL